MLHGVVRSILFTLTVAVATPCAAQGQQPPAGPGGLTKGQRRDTIAAWNHAWGRARVALDTATFQRMLHPSYVAVMGPGQEMSRADFLAGISAPPPGVVLKRFDVEVLTVVPRDSVFEAVIQEKLEIERRAQDGSTFVTKHLWIIKDTWRQVDGKWAMVRGEVVANEGWRGVEQVPFTDW